MVLPSWDTNLDPAENGIRRVADLSVEQGLMSARPDLDELIVPADPGEK